MGGGRRVHWPAGPPLPHCDDRAIGSVLSVPRHLDGVSGSAPTNSVSLANRGGHTCPRDEPKLLGAFLNRIPERTGLLSWTLVNARAYPPVHARVSEAAAGSPGAICRSPVPAAAHSLS